MSETWSYLSLDSTSSLRGRLAMTMVDLQGEEGKGQVGGGSRAKGRGKWESREKEMMVLAHTLVYLKSWTAYVSPPSALCTHTLPPPSAHTTPPSLCTHHSPSLCTHHSPLPLHTPLPPPSAHTHTQESGCTSYHMRCSTLTMVSLSTLPGDPLPYSQVHVHIS